MSVRSFQIDAVREGELHMQMRDSPEQGLVCRCGRASHRSFNGSVREGKAVAEQVGTWTKVGVDSSLRNVPTSVPVVPVHGTLKLLPFEALEFEWPDFESLLWRVLRDVEGLRDTQVYGLPGQTQLGLDLVALAADGSGTAVQSKRVKQFGPAKIQAAVDAFRNTTRPFPVTRFVIGVSREVRSTEAVNKIAALRAELAPIDLVIWDKRELSAKLRHHPDIVREYFGEAIAENFCAPYVTNTIVVPSVDAVAIRDAVARTPEVSTGAVKLVAEAEKLAETDPDGALALVQEAQAKLADAGFAAHASQHEALRASLLLKLNRGEEGTRRRLDDLWHALDLGLTTHAGQARNDIASLASKIATEVANEQLSVAERALALYTNPLATVPDWDTTQAGTSTDRARLALLAGETALAASNQGWLTDNAPNFAALADGFDSACDDVLPFKVRLRILAAEGSGEWAALVTEARTGKLGQALGGLVSARHARYLALRQNFELAEAAWDEASACACLAEHWTDAARWTLSRRAFRIRWKPFTSNELLPLQTALSAHGPGKSVVPQDEDALENAYAQLADNRVRSASISAQRALRDAVTLSDWSGERDARRVLADILKVSEEPALAAEHLARAGAVTAIKSLAGEQADNYLDVTALLDGTPYWIAGTAYRFIAEQGDLVPDDAVEEIGDKILSELDARTDGTLVDLFGFAESRFQGAVAALGGIAGRLTEAQADRALAFFEAQGPVEPGHYRYHDDDEAEATAAILSHHPALADRALAHLVALLARADGSRKGRTVDPVTDRIDQARPLLTKVADEGNAWARELLAAENPSQVDEGVAKEALLRLTTPLEHMPGVIHGGIGGAAISDSILIGGLSGTAQQAALAQLMERADDPNILSSDRSSYLVAAANLASHVDPDARGEYIETALNLVVAPTPSLADLASGGFSHPLGAMRMALSNNSRGQAAFLAASLAAEADQKVRVRDAAFTLVGDDSVSEYWVTRALQRLGDALAGDVGFLSGQGWALKSLAAILWAKSPTPAPVGYRLATDADVRVRRALAAALAGQPVDETSDEGKLPRQVAAVLTKDPCHSVREAARVFDSESSS